MSMNSTFSIVQQYMNRWFCPILLAFGIIGCFLNIFLFSQKQFRIISCCTYFLAASVAMMISLIIGLSLHVFTVDHPNPANTIPIFCKIRGYLNQSLAMMYRWLMTMACIDRYMVSSRNMCLREFSNPQLAYSIVRKILIICIVLPAHNLLFLGIKRGMCMNLTDAFAVYHSFFTLTLAGLLPPLIMIISIILIRHNLASKRALRQHDIRRHNEEQAVRLINARDNQVLVMLFIQVVFYIFSTIPWVIFLLYSSQTRRIRNKSTDRIVIEKFMAYLTEIIAYMYPTLSFYIYTLTSHTFRGELVNAICTLVTGRDRLHHDTQLLGMRAGVGWKDKSDQSSTTYNFQSIGMKTVLDSSRKNSPSVEQQEVDPSLSDSSPKSLLSMD